MSASALHQASDVALYHCDHEALARLVGVVVGGCDALIVDAPYSARTHSGFDSMVGKGDVLNREIAYRAWSDHEVSAFVAAWAPITRGWIVSLTDHVLAPVWEREMEKAGRYVFSPIACVEPRGPRVQGDGPAQWSCFAVVSRPRGKAWQKWGSLPGAYVTPPGNRPRVSGSVIGGKSVWLMERLVEDYSRPGDLVVDPCCGAGTTIVAALQTGRRAIGGDVNEAHIRQAAENAKRAQLPLMVLS